MTAPRFSVLVPTRERPATLRHTLRTVAAQPGDDYEIVVADNCGGPETRAIIAALDPRKTRHVRSGEVLPMAVNWERGLAQCAGEYVTVLGDDDALVPSALELMRRQLAATPATLVSWTPHVYWWPDTIVPWYRNLLYVSFGRGAVQPRSRTLLELFYRGEMAFGDVPMIYKAFFHRSLIEEARRRHGGFFVPTDVAPDVASGILGLHLTQSYVHLGRPLSIRGNSGKSNGTAQFIRSLGAEQRETYFREERLSLEQMIHPALVPSPNLHVIVGNTKIKCRERYFPGDDALAVDVRGVLRGMLADLNVEPEAYEENLADIRALAAKLGVALGAADIPPMRPAVRERRWGPVVRNGRLDGQWVNGDLAGVHDIAAAARLVDGLLLPLDWDPDA